MVLDPDDKQIMGLIPARRSKIMAFKVGDFSGYVMSYSTERQEFFLEDENNCEVAKSKTQAELEEKAKKLRLSSVVFPIRAIKIEGQRHTQGRITS